MAKKPQKIRVLGKMLAKLDQYDLEGLVYNSLKALGIEEKQEDVSIYCNEDYDGNFSGVSVQEYKLESDEAYEKRMELDRAANAKEKKRKQDNKSQIEAQEKDTLRKLIKKYGTI